MFVKESVYHNTAISSRALQQHVFSLLQTCNDIKGLTQIHTQIVINKFYQKNFILVKLLSLYITSSSLLNAHKVFENVENPSTTLWNQMIRGYARSKTPQKSVELYKQMVTEKEAEPDEYTYSFLLSACGKNNLFREGEQVHGRVLANGYCSNVYVKTNLVNLYAMNGGDAGLLHARNMFDEMSERNVVTWNSLLKAYLKCGCVDEARRLFDEMPQRNVVSWTTMISGCARNGLCKQALSLFNEMRRARVRPDQVALIAALSACAELGDLKLGRWIHVYVEENFCVGREILKVSLNNALIHMYCSCGEIKEAYEVFRKMRQRSTVSWTSMIMGFSKQGYAEEALVLFECMQNLEARPDEITMLGVLCACSHAGFVNEGRQFFEWMTQRLGIQPTIEHYGCMIDLLSRAGLLEEASSLIHSMPMKPNDAVLGALLGGCRIHCNAELASDFAQKLVGELDHDHAAGYLVLLANVYASAKRWYDVAAVRQKMIKMGVRKPPGRSRVLINGVGHDFVAGDSTHKHTSLIYKTLGEITSQTMWEGYNPDASELFSAVEE
ncbi:pentatricopeptide repeat-containing protein At5g66520-like [Mangifera indica]|uniref:pentatricopeptide repeat-containing protein At5g66520-like n=1 Tax=Mangifera indica TaxID=29780 RepID=UPI001CF9485E|nr:pentatricopeptide repeat-containing protein At5g66520-like [Mangifera indica]